MVSQLNAASGDEFDKVFMEMMIEPHSTAIQEGTSCIQRAEHDELKNLCENIVSSQQQEIDQLQRWLAQWSNISATAVQTTPAANGTATPGENAPSTLPQTGGTFDLNYLAIIGGLLLLGVGLFLVRSRHETH